MKWNEIANATQVTEVVLKGFSGSPMTHIIIFLALLMVFIVTLIANILIIIIVCTDYRLHSPMYFFLVTLSFVEIFGLSSIVPKFLDVLISNRKTISIAGCFIQCLLYFFLFSSVFLILAVMSFDRFVAICQPLRYVTIMKKRVCIQLVLSCFIISCLCLLYPFIKMSKMPFCGYVLDHFFCDSAAMIKLMCADAILIKLSSVMASIVILILPLTITAVSYIFIIYTVIKIPSRQGRQKTFSTCVSHITVVSLVFGSAIFIEIRPPKNYSVEKDKIVHLVINILGPLLNPFIYTLRNQKMKDCIRDAFRNKKISQ